MTTADKTNKLWPYLALVGGVMCVSWSAIFVRWTDMPGTASAFYRMLISTVLVAPTWFFRSAGGDAVRETNPDGKTIWIISAGGLFFALDLAFFNTGILRTSAANATLLGNYSPVVVGLLTWLIFRRRPSANFWLGLLLALVGTAAIVWSDLTTHIGFGVGDAMSVAAAVFFAGYLMITEKVRSSIGTLVFLRTAMLSSMLFLLGFCLALRISLRIPPGHSWLALLGLGLVTQLGGYLALTYALGHLPATVTSVSLLAQGPLTAVLAAFCLSEKVTSPQIFGGLLVLAGVGLANRRAHPEEEANTIVACSDT
ncbi:MAG TPA: DMT family transporter [Candidatus Acidoferrum sp.]|nr:DMT family transporter [Candidatus Acidoferrum sp.]